MLPDDLRIACLLPSATEICVALGLGKYIVGITHECKWEANDSQGVRILTEDGLKDIQSQGEIHQAISSATPSCSNKTDKNEIPSFYPLLENEFNQAKPNLVFTQDLCAVCAPTTTDVEKLLVKDQTINIVSLSPSTLDQVADTFVTVASACGIKEQGVAYREKWWSELEHLQTLVRKHSSSEKNKRLFLLEWLDPVFDSGHWTYQMMDFACIEMANFAAAKSTVKSKQIEWQDVYDAKPDVVVIGCCGFDLDRNVQDALRHSDKLAPVANTCKIFACDGNSYIAQPGPSLLQGVAVLAQCAYHDQPQVLNAIDSLAIIPLRTGFQLIDLQPTTRNDASPTVNNGAAACGIVDIEDLAEGFAQLHDKACQEGKRTYDDPETGYLVFTELAHKNRGYCCGSGCRHCPYSHQNVGDKAKKIQQPAILYQQSSEISLFSITKNKNIKVLFNSGGKDSFLTIRALVKSYTDGEPFGLVLLTTFDASSRMIAHQEILIDDVIKQAIHLDITLLGIPMRRASGETYKSRIQQGLDIIQGSLPSDHSISSLVFGDLHLENIKAWRDDHLNSLGFQLEYPLWKADYQFLFQDLESSHVPCYVSASTVEEVTVGSIFNEQFRDSIAGTNIDLFGEAGEFHTLAKVWEVNRNIALG